MGFFGLVLKPGQEQAIEVPPGWCLQLCTAALEPAKAGAKPREVSATLWFQVEGQIGDTQFLVGTLQGGGPTAQIPVGHCFTSVDGEVIIEAKGGGVVHLTGFFNREYDPELDQQSSDEDEDSEDDDDIQRLKRYFQDSEDDEDEDEEDVAEDGTGNRGLSSEPKRRIRPAAAAAALACGTGGEEENSEDDSEVDGEYVPGEGDDDDDDDDDEEDDDDDDDMGGDDDEEEENKDKDRRGHEEKEVTKKEQKHGKKRAATPGGVGTSGAGAGGAPSSSGQQRPAKKSRPTSAAEETAMAAASQDVQEAEGDKAAAGTTEMTKAERRKQRRRENKRKAAEAKKGLEEAFSAMNREEDGEPPVGVPLKNPRTKTLKGGLKIKDTTLGGGKVAVPGKNVKVCYEGCFPDGRVFDKNNNRRRPLQFRIGMKKVIAGMDRGVEGMRVGGSREISIPAALGYGARGTGPIPANQDLVFRVELVDVLGK